MNQNTEQKEWPSWVVDNAVWSATDERDFLCVMKAYDRFMNATGDTRIASVLVMAWAALQAGPKVV